MGETIGYEGITTETVDTESQYEREIKEIISKSQEELGALENNSIKNLTDKQLAAYMTNQFLEGGVQRYSHYINPNNLNTLEFCLRAALQLLGKGSDEKYDAKGGKAPGDPNAKTIDERLMASNGITVDGKIDDTIVRILQGVVGAEVDGKPGPQTIVKTVLKLGGNVSKYYEQVNNIYKGNSKYEIKDIETFTSDLLDRSYSYDLSKLTMMTIGGEVYLKPVRENEPKKVTIDPNTKVPSLDGYVFKDGWVYKKGGNAPQSVIPEDINRDNYKEALKSFQLPQGYSLVEDGSRYKLKDASGNVTNSSIDFNQYSGFTINNRDQDKNLAFVMRGNKIEIINNLKQMSYYKTKLESNLKLNGFTDFKLTNVRDYVRRYRIENSDFDAGREYYIYDILDSNGEIDENKWNDVKESFKKSALPDKFAKDLRGKTFSFDDLFGNDYNFGTSGVSQSEMLAYFDIFNDGKVRISDEKYPGLDQKYTKARGTDGKILVRLDDSGPDKEFHQGNQDYLFIDSKDIDNGNYGIDPNKLKEVMQKMVIRCCAEYNK